MIRLKAPKGVTQSTIEGHHYDVDETGHIAAINLGHAQILRRHGYTAAERAPAPTPMTPPAAPVSPAATEPTRAEKMAYLEERGLRQKGNVSNVVLDEVYDRVKADNDAVDAAHNGGEDTPAADAE